MAIIGCVVRWLHGQPIWTRNHYDPGDRIKPETLRNLPIQWFCYDKNCTHDEGAQCQSEFPILGFNLKPQRLLDVASESSDITKSTKYDCKLPVQSPIFGGWAYKLPRIFGGILQVWLIQKVKLHDSTNCLIVIILHSPPKRGAQPSYHKPADH